jgi:hypothetical protein
MIFRPRLLLVLLASVAILSGGGVVRGWLLSASRERLAQRYAQRLSSISEREAALLVRRLALEDDEWLEVIVRAACDPRPGVCAAAGVELRELVNRWSQSSAANSSSGRTALAELLAEHAPQLPPERRYSMHALARRLLAWPVDWERMDAGEFIADCQGVLLLPLAEPAEIRVATTPEPRMVEPALEPPPAAPVEPAQPVIQPGPELRLPGEPELLQVPSVRRISDC